VFSFSFCFSLLQFFVVFRWLQSHERKWALLHFHVRSFICCWGAKQLESEDEMKRKRGTDEMRLEFHNVVDLRFNVSHPLVFLLLCFRHECPRFLFGDNLENILCLWKDQLKKRKEKKKKCPIGDYFPCLPSFAPTKCPTQCGHSIYTL
jgi:hypothetical protein